MSTTGITVLKIKKIDTWKPWTLIHKFQNEERLRILGCNYKSQKKGQIRLGLQEFLRFEKMEVELLQTPETNIDVHVKEKKQSQPSNTLQVIGHEDILGQIKTHTI